MDVLLYSAFNAQKYLTDQVTDKQTCYNTKLVETNDQVSAAANFTAETACWFTTIEPALLKNPAQLNYWPCIPTGSGWTGGFQVCDSTSYFYCGQCCAWTVPAGVTCARFQIWGPGSGSSGAQCCGGSPFGSSGAYASVIIPVVQNSTYTLCAGCACQCCAQMNSGNRGIGVPSYVVGPGLNNFCAQVGTGQIGSWMNVYGKTTSYKLGYYTGNLFGSCICGGGNAYCFNGSCATCGEIPHLPGATYHGTTDYPGIPVYGIRGMSPKICFDTNHYGYQYHAPIYGFESTSCCGITWTSSWVSNYNCKTCCGNLHRVPGSGGWGMIAMGGTPSYAGRPCRCGKPGKAGMVCVSYK
jgi:hypothetical protein